MGSAWWGCICKCLGMLSMQCQQRSIIQRTNVLKMWTNLNDNVRARAALWQEMVQHVSSPFWQHRLRQLPFIQLVVPSSLCGPFGSSVGGEVSVICVPFGPTLLFPTVGHRCESAHYQAMGLFCGLWHCCPTLVWPMVFEQAGATAADNYCIHSD